MKKTFRRSVTALAALVLSMGVCFGFTGCRRGGEEKYDLTKTNINVQVFNGGFGYDWLEKIEKEFEEKYSDYVNGDLVGVDIHINPTSETGTNVYDRYAVADNDVYFTEQVSNYYDFVKAGYVLDITEEVTENIAGQNHSIESVLQEDLRNYYGVDRNGEKHYYGLPYSNAFINFIYDSELFYNKGLYFTREYDSVAAGTPIGEYMIKKITEPGENGEFSALVTESGQSYYKTTRGDYLSKGPDGKYGTYDDGMPKTYDEFFALCRYMSEEENVTPFLWMGKGGGAEYVTWAMNQIVADYEGYDQMFLTYSYNGAAKTLVSANGNGTVSGLPEVTLTPNNSNGKALEVHKSAGRYYALDFLGKMLANDDAYCMEDCFNTIRDQFYTQETFMLSKRNPEKAAFMVDGIWWEHEARDTYADLANSYGDAYKKENRKFKMFTMPKQNPDKIGEPATFIDTGYQVAFIRSSIEENKKEICKKFLQFCFTDAANKEYTVTTGAPRPYDYTLSDTEYGSLSSFAKSVWDAVKSDKKSVVYPYSTSEYYLNKNAALNPHWMFYTRIDGTDYTNIFEVMRTKKLGVKRAFDGIYDYAAARIGN